MKIITDQSICLSNLFDPRNNSASQSKSLPKNSEKSVLVMFSGWLIALMSPKSAQAAGTLLPSGYLTTSGNQITDLFGHKVRLACVGYVQSTSGVEADIKAMAAYGFNCVRYPWYNTTMATSLTTIMDQVVHYAGTVGLKVIFDHHGDETPKASNCYLSNPYNGLPFDLGAGTNGTDGVGGCANAAADRGTVTRERFVNDWVTVAKHYAGNATVIGFDLTNEPHLYPAGWVPVLGATWGDGSATDLRSIYIEAGNAIQKVNPHVLIIAEGIENWTPKLLSGASNPLSGYGDLSVAGTKPITLGIPKQLVYSVHDYPKTISSTAPDNGKQKIAAMTATWGYLVAKNIAPVWIGEMGASLDGVGSDSKTSADLADEKAWAATLLAYVNGLDGATGGPTFSGCAQGVDTDWWAWGNLDRDQPDGTLLDSGQPRPYQQSVTKQLLFVRKTGC